MGIHRNRMSARVIDCPNVSSGREAIKQRVKHRALRKRPLQYGLITIGLYDVDRIKIYPMDFVQLDPRLPLLLL